MFDSNHICTTGKEVVVGKRYQYTEDGYIAAVTVLEDNSDDEAIRFKLRIDERLRWPDWATEDEFDVMAARGPGAYSGMWRIWNDGEYVKITASPAPERNG